MGALQEVKKRTVTCALEPTPQRLSTLAATGSQGRELLHYYGFPQLARQLARIEPMQEAAVELLEGARVLLYKHPLPGEAQARLAYEYVLDEFVRFLEQQGRTVAEGESEGHVLLWFPLRVPEDPESWLKERWRTFLDKLTSAEGFRRTFALALNSAKLAGGAGFSVLETPIFSRSHALSMAGLYWLGLGKGLEVNRRDLDEAQILESKAEAEEDPKKTQKAHEDAARKRAKARAFEEQVRNLLSRQLDKESGTCAAQVLRKVLEGCSNLQEIPARLKRHNPALYAEIEQAALGYGSTAREQLNSARGNIFSKILWELVRLAEGNYELLPLPSLLSLQPFTRGLRPAGDAHGRFCYSCGQALGKKEEAYKSRRLLFEAPEQRAQSAGSSGWVKVCATCAGLSLLSPVKLSDEALVIRLGGRGEASEEARQAFERLVLNELGASAGPYISLRATETANDQDRTPAPQAWGRRQYATAKLALTLSPEVFRRGSEVRLYEKGGEVRLDPHALYAAAGLSRAYRQEIRAGNDLNRRLGRAVRYLDRGQWVFGEYELLLGLIEGGFDASDLATIQREAEEFRGGLEEMMRENEQAARDAQKYRDVVGYASLLHAFTEEARRALRDRTDLKQEDKDRELRKLVQLADSHPPIPFLNRVAAARTTTGEGYGYDEVRLYWDDRHQYGYQWAKGLLEEVDQEVSLNLERESTGEWEGKPSRFFSLRPEDLIAVAEFLRTRYPSSADWRNFLYQAKLFLFTRYPRLLQD